MFSVVILTLNEERNLPKCLASVAECNDIVVLDSGSKDRTPEIAIAAGARVVERKFDTFAGQRNFADHQIPFKHEWVFHLDADEQFTSELFAECRRFSNENPLEIDGYYAAPRMFFRGRWIPHCTDFPAYQARFVRAGRFEFIQVGHGQRESPQMKMGKLKGHYLHDLSADGETALVEKHRKYAKHEAHAQLQDAAIPATSETAPSLLSANHLERRRALKRLSRHLPARGLSRFFYQYVLRCGFLDGQAGLAYCLLMARYEHWISQEIRRQRRSAK